MDINVVGNNRRMFVERLLHVYQLLLLNCLALNSDFLKPIISQYYANVDCG